MKNQGVAFEEIGRVKVSESRDIVASKVRDTDGVVTGFHFNSYIRTQKYTGFSNGGLFVPEPQLEEYGELVKKVLSC